MTPLIIEIPMHAQPINVTEDERELRRIKSGAVKGDGWWAG
jgi:hypothetical protein